MPKETASYSIEEENVKWVKRKANEDGRSPSNFVDNMLTKARKQDEEGM